MAQIASSCGYDCDLCVSGCGHARSYAFIIHPDYGCDSLLLPHLRKRYLTHERTRETLLLTGTCLRGDVGCASAGARCLDLSLLLKDAAFKAGRIDQVALQLLG